MKMVPCRMETSARCSCGNNRIAIRPRSGAARRQTVERAITRARPTACASSATVSSRSSWAGRRSGRRSPSSGSRSSATSRSSSATGRSSTATSRRSASAGCPVMPTDSAAPPLALAPTGLHGLPRAATRARREDAQLRAARSRARPAARACSTRSLAMVAASVDEPRRPRRAGRELGGRGRAARDGGRLDAAHARRRGRDLLDLDLFLSIYPWAMRPALARIAHGVMAQYHDPRTVLVDVASNLIKERHERWLPALLEAANAARLAGHHRTRGASLLRPRPPPVAADAAASPRRPRLAAPRAPASLPVPAAAAVPLRPTRDPRPRS